MFAVFQPLFRILAQATEQELARQVQYLKVENQILREKLPKRLTVAPEEKQLLLKYGELVGAAIKELITIVTPRTFARWKNEPVKKRKTPKGKPGRPRTPDEIRELVVRFAKENAWGYTRILGELKKLGVGTITRQTVKNILKENGLAPGPKRGQGTWDDFLKRHAKTLWQCDFFSQKVVTLGGIIDMYVLVFLRVDSRRVWVSPATANPNAVWVAQQARNIVMHFDDCEDFPEYVTRDADTKFTKQFDEIFETENMRVQQLPFRSPNLNAYAERWIQSLRRECLGHFIVFGEKHLNHLVDEYVEFYNTQRPHQSKNNEPLTVLKLLEKNTGEVVCHERLGGILKHDERRAA